jgi:hypothetical protein
MKEIKEIRDGSKVGSCILNRNKSMVFPTMKTFARLVLIGFFDKMQADFPSFFKARLQVSCTIHSILRATQHLFLSPISKSNFVGCWECTP